jgi:predicted Fe-Mo cluster-binding NifX family protein
MKIAIPAAENGWNKNVDTRFGRAIGFFIIDDKNNQTEFIDNTKNITAEHGAGTSTAQMIVEAGVKTLLTNKVGPKAGSVLKAAGIKAYTGIDGITIEEAYNLYKNNKLTEQEL